MQRTVQRALRRGEESNLTQRILHREYFSLHMLAEEALRGDSVALKVYSELGRWLSSAIAKYVTLFEPDTVMLSGSIVQNNELLLTQVRNTAWVLATPSSATCRNDNQIAPCNIRKVMQRLWALRFLYFNV